MSRVRAIFACAAVAAVLLLAASARAATSCNATVRATAKSDQTTTENTVKVWAVEIDTQQDCAKVYVDLITTERLFDGEEIKSTHRGSRTVHGGVTMTYKVDYPIARDSTLTDSSFKVAKCVVCGTE
jgi:hypothetical protein